jgi:hypothetical protein
MEKWQDGSGFSRMDSPVLWKRTRMEGEVIAVGQAIEEEVSDQTIFGVQERGRRGPNHKRTDLCFSVFA